MKKLLLMTIALAAFMTPAFAEIDHSKDQLWDSLVQLQNSHTLLSTHVVTKPVVDAKREFCSSFIILFDVCGDIDTNKVESMNVSQKAFAIIERSALKAKDLNDKFGEIGARPYLDDTTECDSTNEFCIKGTWLDDPRHSRAAVEYDGIGFVTTDEKHMVNIRMSAEFDFVLMTYTRQGKTLKNTFIKSNNEWIFEPGGMDEGDKDVVFGVEE